MDRVQGVLNIELSDAGGNDPNWALSRLSLEKVSDSTSPPITPRKPVSARGSTNLSAGTETIMGFRAFFDPERPRVAHVCDHMAP